jgi:hypothetical protein
MEPITYRLDETDIVAANDLWRRAAIRVWRILVLAGIYWAMWFGIFLLVVNHLSVANVIGALVGTAIAALLVVMIVIWINGRFYFPRRARKSFRQHKAIHHPITLQWTEDRVLIDQETAHNHMPWQDLVRWAEDDRTLILLITDMLFSPVPKRALSPALLEEVRSRLLAANVPKARLFPI